MTARDVVTRFKNLYRRLSQTAIFQLFKETGSRWFDDNTFLHGAALAYYTVFSLAPLLLIAISIAGLLFGEKAARGQIAAEIGQTVGTTVGQAIEVTIEKVHNSHSGLTATLIGLAVLLFGASSVFVQLQESLNTIWGVQAKPGRGLWGVLQDRFLSFAAVLAIGFLLLVSLLVTAGLSALANFLSPAWLVGSVYLWQAVNWLVSFVFIALLFAMIYKVLPDVIISWRDVWVGAVVTALLFTAGKYLIGLYLGRSTVTSAYGAAGSLVLILLWVYYSSQIFLFGAEFTRVYANHSGKPLVPTANAMIIARESETAPDHTDTTAPADTRTPAHA